MGAVPKRKISRSRRGGRRSHQALNPAALVECSQCHQPTLPHRVCPACGYYKGIEVVPIKIEAEKK